MKIVDGRIVDEYRRELSNVPVASGALLEKNSYLSSVQIVGSCISPVKIRITFNRLAVAFAIIATFCVACPVSGEEINIQNVPLDEAVKVLARLTGRNFILSPKLKDSVDADGKPVPRPTLNIQTNATPEQVLAAVLEENGLVMVDDPVTTVTRIAYKREPVKKADAGLLAGDTNAPVPTLVFQDIPLGTALNSIAALGKMEIEVDSKIADSYRNAEGNLVVTPSVSLRWNNLTARQAALALCINYNLNVTKNETSGAWRIEPKK